MHLLLILLGGLWYLGNTEVRRFENLAAHDISAKLQGLEREVRVHVKIGPEAVFGDVHEVTIQATKFETEGLPLFTEPNRSTRGLLRTLKLDMSDFSLRGLHVQSLRAELPDCRFDFPLAVRKQQIRLTRSGVGPGEVVLSERDLADFIKLKLHEIKSVSVRLDKDKIFVDGHGEFILFEADFSVVAKLEPLDGTKLVLSYARVLVDGLPASEAAKQALLDTLNPVIDLNKDLLLHHAVRVQSIRVQSGQMRAAGLVKIPDLPASEGVSATYPPR